MSGIGQAPDPLPPDKQKVFTADEGLNEIFGQPVAA